MNKTSLLLLLALTALAPRTVAQKVSELSASLRNQGVTSFCQSAAAGQPLSLKKAQQLRDSLTAQWRADQQRTSRAAWQSSVMTSDTLQLKFDRQIFGSKPADGRSLYISLHGGGAMTEAFNNGQWNNQKRLYRPAEGVYIAPRAPWNAWNMWFLPGLDGLLEQLISAEIVWDDVNPDKVYLLGYSAGGDGVWRMAPRMADRWAAASMMAGHPGEASQVNLLNVPFMIWMGEHDAEYNRNALAAAKGLVMDSLQRACPEGYVHETHIVKGRGHWMEHADTAAIAWMARYQRNPLPRHIVWRQEDVILPTFYWLEVRPTEARPGMRVDAVIHPERNEVELLRCDYTHLTLWLNDELLNLNKTVRVTYQGNVLFKGKVNRTAAHMVSTLWHRGDPRWCFSARIDVEPVATRVN